MEVRSAGATRRLYVDGTLHTQYNPQHALTGGVWDAMALATAFAPKGAIQNALMLGVGGGASLQLLRRHFSPKRIVGVELDATRIALSKRFFGLNHSCFSLIAANAIDWLKAYQGPSFDLIVEDLYQQENGEPVPVTTLDAQWTETLCRHLQPNGVLVINTIDTKHIRESALMRVPAYRKRFVGAYRIKHSHLDNRVAIFTPHDIGTAAFRSRLEEMPTLQSKRAREKLRFRMSKIW